MINFCVVCGSDDIVLDDDFVCRECGAVYDFDIITQMFEDVCENDLL